MPQHRIVRKPDPRQWSRWQAPGVASRAVGPTDGGRGAPLDRRLVSQTSTACPARTRSGARRSAYLVHHAAAVRRRDGARGDRHGEGSPAQAGHGRGSDRGASGQLQGERSAVDHGRRSLRGAEDARGAPERRRDAHSGGRTRVHQRGNARGHPGNSRPRGGPTAHATSRHWISTTCRLT